MSKGIPYILVATFSFSLVNLQVKYLPRIPIHELVFFRSVVSFIICFTWMRYRHISVTGNNHPWLITRGLTGATGLTLFFYTIQHMPMATATTLQYMSPVFTVALAYWLLNDRIKSVQWLLFLLSFAGIVMIKGFDERVSVLLLAAGLISAGCSAIAYNAIVKCRTTDHPLTVVIYFPLVAIPITGIWCLFDWKTPMGYEWLILLSMGILTQVAQVCMTRALNLERPSIITPFKYLGIIYAFVYGFLWFDETFNFMTITGMILVIGGILINTRVGKKGYG